MTEKPGSNLPSFIEQALLPTPSGVAKVLTAWDGLSIEAQIAVLSSLPTRHLPGYLSMRIRTKALDSPNAYVRYLAAKGLHFDKEASAKQLELKARIEADPDPLVRYSLLEESRLFDKELEDATAFFALPHDARLAKVRELTDGRVAAKLVEHAVEKLLPEGKVSEIELFEILCDYLKKSDTADHFRTPSWYSPIDLGDSMIMHQRAEELITLWALVPKVPEAVSYLLIENLPVSGGSEDSAPEVVVDKLNDHQLTTLFHRPDVQLREERRKVFLAGDDKDRLMRWAAASHHLKIEPEDIATLANDAIALPPSGEMNEATLNRRRRAAWDLSALAEAKDAEPVYREAAIDIIQASGETDALHVWSARESIEHYLLRSHHIEFSQQVLRLRLYRLAREAVPWGRAKTGYAPSGALGFLSQEIREKDTWGTYLAFIEAWKKGGSEALEGQLPRIEEIGELWNERGEATTERRRAERNGARLEAGIRDVLDHIRPDDEKANAELSSVVRRMVMRGSEVEARLAGAISDLAARLADHRRETSSQRWLLYIVIAIAVIILILRH